MNTNTTNFSVRTKTETLSIFDSIVRRQKLSRSSVIESFMVSYIKAHSVNEPDELKVVGELAKYKGIASKLTHEDVTDDPRAKHALGYE